LATIPSGNDPTGGRSWCWVGGQAIAVSSDERFLVGPNNGVLLPALLLPGARVVSLPVPTDAAPSVHGGDIFAPTAAALAHGARLDSFGLPLGNPIIRRTTEAVREQGGWLRGEVIVADRSGNAVTNLMAMHGGAVRVDHDVPMCRAYADVASGEAVALFGSSGFIEIAIGDGRAAASLGITGGTVVPVRDRDAGRAVTKRVGTTIGQWCAKHRRRGSHIHRGDSGLRQRC
jgi:S-adenosylmethionine hydrolase